jgi:hypothetical protein
VVTNSQLTMYLFFHSPQLRSPPRQINEFNCSTHMKSILLSICVKIYWKEEACSTGNVSAYRRHSVCPEYTERAGHKFFLRNDDLQT